MRRTTKRLQEGGVEQVVAVLAHPHDLHLADLTVGPDADAEVERRLVLLVLEEPGDMGDTPPPRPRRAEGAERALKPGRRALEAAG